MKKKHRRHREKTATYRPRRDLRRTEPADDSALGFQSPGI